MKTLKTRDELLAELAELQAANEAATSWGAAVGARHERIKQIQSTLRHPPAPPMSPHTDAGALLKLAAGKSYRDRWGDVHGPLDERAPGCFLDQHGAVYQPDGRQWNHLSQSMSTIVAEVES